MWPKPLFNIPASAAMLAIFLTASTAQADVLWSNPWTYSAPMPLTAFYTPSATLTTDGGIIIGADSASGRDWQNTRLNPDGSLRWVANLNGFENGSGGLLYPAIEMSDGGAIVSRGIQNPYGGSDISRIGPNGELKWSRSALIDWKSTAGPGRVAYLGCNVLTLADTETGEILWQRSYDRSARCRITNGAVDVAGNVYATFNQGDAATITGFRVVKFDVSGTAIWETGYPTAGAGSIVGIGTDNLFIKIGSDLQALSAADGTSSWSLPVATDAKLLVSADPAADPIVAEGSRMRRIADLDGAVLWTMTDSFCIYCDFSIAADGAILATTNAGLNKIDAATGTAIWTSPLPTQNTDGNSLHWLRFGGVTGNRLLGVAQAWNYNITATHIQTIDYDSGAMLAAIPAPAMAQGVDGLSLASGNDVFEAGYGPDQYSKPVRVRRSDAATGSLIWESSYAPLTAPFVSFYPTPGVRPIAAVGDDGMAVVLPWTRNITNGMEGMVTIAVFDKTSGNLRWSKMLLEPGQELTFASEPQFDTAGNILLGIGTTLPCGSGSSCSYQYIYKFSAASGDVLWRFDNTAPPGGTSEGISYVYPQAFEIFGDDIVIAGHFSGTAHTLIRISGDDASLMWASDLFAGGNAEVEFYRQDDQHIIVESETQSARIDVDNGSVLWTSTPAPLPCAPACHASDQLVLPNGDLIRVGSNNFYPWLSRTHNDGTGQIDFWWLDSHDPQFRSWASHVRLTPSGNIMLITTRRYLGSLGRLSALQEFDLSSGTVASRQVLGGESWDGITETLFKWPIGFPLDNRMLFDGFLVTPTSPNSSDAGLLDTTIAAHGDLSLSISNDLQFVIPGQPQDFNVVVNYSGDVAIMGANVFAGMRVQGNLSNLSCVTQAASNCVFDNRSGNLHATFDIQPGGSITITGQIAFGEQNPLPYFSGVVWGPIGLSEPDTDNNFSRTWTVDELFQDGFDLPSTP